METAQQELAASYATVSAKIRSIESNGKEAPNSLYVKLFQLDSLKAFGGWK